MNEIRFSETTTYKQFTLTELARYIAEHESHTKGVCKAYVEDISSGPVVHYLFREDPL